MLIITGMEQLNAVALAEGNTEFAMDLYREICRAEESDNIFFSRCSISSALGMTYSGAVGQTSKFTSNTEECQ